MEENGIIIGSAPNSATYTKTNLIPIDAASYSVDITSACGVTVSSSPSNLSIFTKPIFTACPSNITVTTTGCAQNKVVTYTATVESLIWNPGGTAPLAYNLDYVFTGATTGSGSGTGSGSVFNAGHTTVTLTAINTCSSVTCVFDIFVDVSENVAITCPGNVIHATVNKTGCMSEISLANPVVSGVCDVNTVIVTWSMTGANTDSGTGFVGTYSFNTGTTTITYTATDANSNTATCSFTVQVDIPVIAATVTGTTTVNENDPPPVITFTGSGGSLPYTFTYTINGGTPLTITTTGANTTATVTQPTNVPGVYTYHLVSMTDANGCSGTVDPQDAVVTVVDVMNVELFPTIPSPIGTSFAVGQTKNGYIQITNTGSDASSGTVTFLVSKVANFTMIVPPNMTMSGSTIVDNTAMTITDLGTIFLVTFNSTISAGGNIKLGYTLTATGLKGSNGTLTAGLVNNSGGDSNSGNNTAIKLFGIN